MLHFPFSYQTKVLCLFLSVLGISSTHQAQDSLTVYFPINGHEINPGDITTIKSFLNNTTRIISSVEIRAFCDDTGGESTNYKLSVRRAEALQKQFIEAGLDYMLIKEVSGLGSLPLNNLSGELTSKRALLRRATAFINYASLTEENREPINKEAADTIIKKSLIRDSVRTGEAINLQQVLFVGGTRQILPDSKPALQNLVEELRSRPDLRIRIEGHVCCTPPGKDGKDLDTKKNNLSEVRAKAVYDHLVKAGIDQNRLDYVGKKGDFPLGGDVTLDRRVEIVVTRGGSPD